MRLARKGILDSFETGKVLKIKKISEGEFISYSKKEIGLLFAEGVTEKSAEKFADLMEVINSVCKVLKIDFYECMKIRSEKRYKNGEYINAVFDSEFIHDQEE